MDLDQPAEKANVRTAKGMFAALGVGNLRLTRLINYAQQLVEPDRDSEQLELIPHEPSKTGRGKRGDMQIQGAGSPLTQMVGCCQPLPGDPIVGCIALGRGAAIRRQDCATALQLAGREPERMIQASWGPRPVRTYPVDVAVRVYDRSGLLYDASQVSLNERINALAVNTRSNRGDNTTIMQLTIGILGLDALERLLTCVSQPSNIIEARRGRTP